MDITRECIRLEMCCDLNKLASALLELLWLTKSLKYSGFEPSSFTSVPSCFSLSKVPASVVLPYCPLADVGVVRHELIISSSYLVQGFYILLFVRE